MCAAEVQVHLLRSCWFSAAVLSLLHVLHIATHSLSSPGYQAKSIEDVPGNPTLAVTADFNYVLRFYKGNGRVWVKDVQGNDVNIKSKPIQFGQLSVILIDRVLMSGGYFFNGLVRGGG
jgi:hypothetical protein